MVPLDPVLLPFAGAKGRPPRRAVLTTPLQKAPRRRQAKGNFGIICAINPSVSRSADTSPYAGEPLGRCDADKRDETGIACIGNPSVTAAPCHLSLHKGGFRRQATANLANSLLLLLRGKAAFRRRAAIFPRRVGKAGKNRMNTGKKA